MNVPTSNPHAAIKRAQQGMSLIEIMVSLTIGLLLTLGTAELYLKSRQSYDTSESVSRVQEIARYAMNQIEHDVRLAGHFGRSTNQKNTVQFTNATGKSPDECGTGFAFDLSHPIQSDNDSFLSAAAFPNTLATINTVNGLSPTRTAACGAGPNGNIMPFADTLTIRHAAVNNNPTSSLIICSRFGIAFDLVANAAACSTAENGTENTNNEANDLVVNAYYVSQDSTGRRNVPSLRRKELVTGPAFQDQEIAPGIEDMQIMFGVNPSVNINPQTYTWGSNRQVLQYVNGNDGAVLNQVDAAANTVAQIQTVRVWLLVRDEVLETGYRDTQLYEYGSRSKDNGTTANLTDAGTAGFAYQPNDGYRRILISRTFQIVNGSF